MNTPLLPLRLGPGADLRQALDDWLAERGLRAAFLVAGVGSLSRAQLRMAGADELRDLSGPLEIIAISGSLSPDGPHLHAALSDADGRVTGGHLRPGCIVETTAELLLAPLPGHAFRRVHDAGTGYAELQVEESPDLGGLAGVPQSP